MQPLIIDPALLSWFGGCVCEDQVAYVWPSCSSYELQGRHMLLADESILLENGE